MPPARSPRHQTQAPQRRSRPTSTPSSTRSGSLGTAYVIGDDDRLFHDCFIKTTELNSESDSGSYCHADFADPVPPIEEDYGVPHPPAPNVINWDRDGGRFSTAYAPGDELHSGTHLHGGGYRVTKGRRHV